MLNRIFDRVRYERYHDQIGTIHNRRRGRWCTADGAGTIVGIDVFEGVIGAGTIVGTTVPFWDVGTSSRKVGRKIGGSKIHLRIKVFKRTQRGEKMVRKNITFSRGKRGAVSFFCFLVVGTNTYLYFLVVLDI